LTDGMQSIDLEALRVTSHSASLRLGRRRFGAWWNYFKFGLRDDPWEQLDATKVKKAGEILAARHRATESSERGGLDAHQCKSRVEHAGGWRNQF